MKLTTVTLAPCVLGGMLTLVASSCAEASDDSSSPDAGGVIAPPSDAGADAPAVSDAGCEASVLGCAPPPLPPCDAVEWCPVATPLDGRLGLASIWGSSKNDVWAVGSGGTILHFDGATWKATASGTTEALYAVWGSGPQSLWAVSSTHLVLRSAGYQNGAATWQPTAPLAAPNVYSAAGKLVRAVWGNDTSGVIVASESFALDWKNPSANRWRAQVSGNDVSWGAASNCIKSFDPAACPSMYGLWGTGATELWAVGARGATSHAVAADDAGIPTWSSLDSQSSADLHAVWGSGPGDVWMVGGRGTIRHFAAGAERLAIVDSPTSATLRAVWGSGPSDVWAVGDGGTILHFDGTSWTAATAVFPAAEKPTLRGVWGSAADDVWIVGDAVVLHFTGKKPGASGGGQ